MPNATAIDRDSELPPKININGGTINIPHGTVAVGEVTLNNAAGVTGAVIKQPLGQLWSDNNWSNWSIELYGACSVPTTFEDDENNEKTIENISWHIMPGATATVEEGTTWNIRESWKLQNEGTLDIYGTVTNFDQFANNGTINNYSSNTLDNRGVLTNNGTINNESTGRIRNTGRIVNTGTIDNKGVFQSVQTASEMGGTITGNSVQPLNSSSGGGGSGGCNAGLGVFGLLLLAGLVTRKHRLIRLNSPK
jgi:MYXO-CTERM domain-containing protein